jgi:hypothetical protein
MNFFLKKFRLFFEDFSKNVSRVFKEYFSKTLGEWGLCYPIYTFFKNLL